jgi:hypothetical protein
VGRDRTRTSGCFSSGSSVCGENVPTRSGLSGDDAAARRRAPGCLAHPGSGEWTSRAKAVFAEGVERDKSAVQAGLTLAINNGQVEGQVTRIKLIKRMMYGKAGFALLRQRVLHRI